MLPRLEAELELISSSLLPTESLHNESSDTGALVFRIDSTESALGLHITVSDQYPDADAITIAVKGGTVGREEARGWERWSADQMREWDPSDEYPLFQLLSAHFLTLFAAEPVEPELRIQDNTVAANLEAPHHVLLTSHHLLSPTKRKSLISLSSQLSLVGFSKTGHPGIMYAIGDSRDLVEWLREVKSWNWLALRVRVGVEPLSGQAQVGRGKGKEDGARGGRGRGEWTELEKISEALEWMRENGSEELLLDVGMGSGSGR
ncbi:hypothetical protein BCR39DRAFT_561590 [Naematelia encephala]|uniref:Uncharacterized protein n=1 Tax=Naematelia encephala TaxID=71784 RepID=A0A1Y2AP96_9TREE|nr:hypothetical protein BCR39DRAFT_561590 [Naematelia encephala]